MVGELCELGWLYRKIIEYINMNIDETSIGIVTQSFCYALHQELTEYYRLIALLEQQRSEFETSLNMRKLYFWCAEPLTRMRWMAVLVDAA
jgi:gamma-tubulin complex component 3